MTPLQIISIWAEANIREYERGINMESSSAPKLREEQEKTLATPKRRNGFLAKILFLTMDILYGRTGSLSKFKVLEIIARMPYQAWENVAYIAITHKYMNHDFARRIFDRVHESRIQQDNEQWHLLILAEQIQKRGIQEGFIRFRLFPQILAFLYFHISWILYVIKPSLSYILASCPSAAGSASNNRRWSSSLSPAS